MIIPMPSYYDVGTASVANGDTTITFTGALVGSPLSPNFLPNDLFMDPAQPDVPPQRMASIDYDAATAELAVPWPGITMTSADYEVRYIGDIIRSTAQTRRYLEMLGQLAALGIQPNAFGEFSDRDAYDDQPKGFIFLSLNGDGSTGVWTLYIKQTAASADWDGGQEVEGPKGDTVTWLTGSGVPGSGTGADGDMYLDTATGDVYGPKTAGAWGSAVANIKGAQGSLGNLRGTWATATAYAVNDVVSQGGSSYVARTAHTSGTFATDLAANKWQLLVSASGGREILTANRTYYVRNDGSNSNNGLSNTAGGAFLTLQKAIDTVAAIDLSIYNVTIQIGAGSYSGATVSSPWVGAGTVTILGDPTTPSNVTVGGVISQGAGSRVTVSGFTVVASVGLSAISSGQIKLGAAMAFGACTFHMRANGPGSVIDAGSVAYSIVGSAAIHYYASPTGAILVFSATVTLTGTPAFSTAFAVADRLGIISANGSTFIGGATGTRYSASINAVIHTGGGGASYFPGNAAGSTATGGQYT